MPCSTALLSSDQQKLDFREKVYLNPHGAATFHHCYSQIPWLPLYPLNCNMETSLQRCNISNCAGTAECVCMTGKNAPISLFLVGKHNAERRGAV